MIKRIKCKDCGMEIENLIIPASKKILILVKVFGCKSCKEVVKKLVNKKSDQMIL